MAQKCFSISNKNGEIKRVSNTLISLKGLKYIFTNFMVLIPVMMDVTRHSKLVLMIVL